MATESKPEAAAKSKGSPVMVVAVACAAVTMGAAGSMFVMMRRMNQAAPALGAVPPGGEHAQAKVADEPPPAEEGGEGEGSGPSVVTLAPFVINLEDDNGDAHFLKLTLAVELKDPKWGKFLERQTPKIRNAVVLLLSNLKVAQTMGAANKHKLRDDLRQSAQEAMGKSGIKDVFITEFVIQ